MDVAGRGQTKPAGELRSEVADDVTKQVAGDDDLKLARVANDFHGERIDVKVAGIDLRIFLADLLEDTLP